MDNNKLLWYEKNIEQYLFDTIYDTDSLIVEMPKERWFKINPTRGIQSGISCYDLVENNCLLSEMLLDVYGELEFDRKIMDSQVFRFSRRGVAAGGALYPNIIYILTKKNSKVKIYQYNPALHLLHYLSIRDANENVFKENVCYFVITNYYWRNWFKYRYFGYRLMNVDTGYLLAEFYAVMINRHINGNIYISDKYFRHMKNYINNDCGKESLCAVVTAENKELLESFEVLEAETSYRLHDDWDTENINLYRTIEERILNESFNINEIIGCDKFGKIFETTDWMKNRISPGGAFMQNMYAIRNEYLFNSLETLKSMLASIAELKKDINLFIYVNRISGIKKGLYNIDFNQKNNLRFIRHIDGELQCILKKHNFNLSEIPALFFISGDTKKYIKKYGISGFKILQIKIGFVSHWITLAAAINNCYTHPILGFDAKTAEKLLQEDNVLNLIAFSNAKPIDRFIVKYRRGKRVSK